MITLSLLKYLEDHGLGVLDENLFWQKLTVSHDGLYVVELGDSQERAARTSTTYELYSRFLDDVKAYQRLEQVAELLNRSYGICTLPAVPGYIDEGFSNVTIMPVSTISNAGLDSEGRVVFSITGKIYFDKPKPQRGNHLRKEFYGSNRNG